MSKLFNRKFFLVMFIIIVFVSISFVSGFTAGKQKTIIHIAHVHTIHHIHYFVASKFKELVEQKTNGEVQVLIHPNAELGSERDYLEMMQAGTLDAGLICSVVFDSYSDALTPYTFPFLLTDDKMAWDFYENVTKVSRFKKLEDDTGIVPLGIYPSGWRDIFSRKPIKSVEDFVNKKYRVMETPMHIDFAKLLGANPTPLPWGEVYTSLQLGTIDLTGNEITSYVNSKFYEVAPYYIKTHHLYTFIVLGVSKKIFDSLDPKIQEAIIESGREATEFWWKKFDEVESENFDKLRKIEGFGKKFHLVEFSAEERSKMREKVLTPLLEKYKDKIGKDVIEWLEKYNKK